MLSLLLKTFVIAISPPPVFAADLVKTEGGLPLLALVGIMATAGLIGGTINFFLLPEEKDSTSLKSWIKSTVVSIGASFLMPLFLNTISSTLVPSILDGKGDSGDILVFSGFCLVGAISSRAFIQTLSSRILREAQEAKQQVEKVQGAVSKVEQAFETVEQAVETIVEPEPESSVEDASDAKTGFREVITDADRSLLENMDRSRFTLRSASGIAKQAGLSSTEVTQRLKKVEDKKLVTKVTGKKGERWKLTPRGRQAIEKTTSNDNPPPIAAKP